MLPKPHRVLFLLIFLLTTSIAIFAQAPTSADVMRDRISKAKAYLVVKNYGAAIYELENIRRETNDRTVHRVINVLLMHSYLEQADYKRAQKFLTTLYKSRQPGATLDYLAVAGQVVSGAKTQLKRYKILGLNVSDEKLPSYAVEDLEEMRKTLELVITHSKQFGASKKLTANSLALLEETSAARSSLARDDYDAKRWKNEVIYARQQLASSGSRVINAVDDGPIEAVDPNIVAANTPVKKPAYENDPPPSTVDNETARIEPPKKEEVQKERARLEVKKAAQNTVAKIDPKKVEETKPLNDSPRPSDKKVRIIKSAEKTPTRAELLARENASKKDAETPSRKEETKPRSRKRNDSVSNNVADNRSNKTKDGEPVSIGSLVGYATKRVNPVYPRQARSMRMRGLVRVKLLVDEDGRVAKVEKTSGPSLLQRAARDAVRKWQFRPFVRDGRPVKATGFVNFNFNL